MKCRVKETLQSEQALKSNLLFDGYNLSCFVGAEPGGRRAGGQGPSHCSGRDKLGSPRSLEYLIVVVVNKNELTESVQSH